MQSIFDELSEKLARDPRVTKRGGPRIDLSVLLFNAREDIRDLWDAADRYARDRDQESLGHLADSVERLRPWFGSR